jgi:peptide/nickel transport system permease protein
MSKYILKRLLWMIPVIIGVAIFIFSILYFVPGDPAQIILGQTATADEISQLRTEMGLDQPYFVQLGRFLYNTFFKFDLGFSYFTHIPVTQELINRIPRTLALGLSTMILTMLIGIPLGIMAAVHQNQLADRICMIVALFGVSLPGFWVALMLVIFFSLKLGWLPATGIGGIEFFILPVISQTFSGIGGQARMSRSSMLEVIRSDYVVTARSKGLDENEVIYKHALPNALMPIITVAGSSLAMIFGGSVITETIFSIPGVGSYMINAINSRDYPVVCGSVLFLAIVFSLCMLLVDITYGLVDPRIKAQFISHKKKGGAKVG